LDFYLTELHDFVLVVLIVAFLQEKRVEASPPTRLILLPTRPLTQLRKRQSY
jgi:hypothetical protein